ncbi:YcaO-like family protein [Aquipuribacter sp. SD81]|uniref:YcaO-like family protein n=1 Tax=Aquipuribacter sp. SD81 TaxID=3127703 RepID=UPI00301A2F9D
MPAQPLQPVPALLDDPVARRMLDLLPDGTLDEVDLTAFDRIGLPVRAASSYPTSPEEPPGGGIGYGADPRAARLSALGELTESAQVSGWVRRSDPVTASTREMVAARGAEAVVDPVALPVDAGADTDPDRPLRWLPGRRWRDGALHEQVWLPAEVVSTSGDDVPGGAPAGGWLVTSVTNGLGAGDTLERAVGHGLLELLQRDGNGLRFRALDAGHVLDVGPGGGLLDDPVTRSALAAFDAAGVDVTVKLASLENDVVNVYAVGRDRLEDGVEPVHPLVVTAAGEGTHPDREVAVRKAVLELAASRARKVFTHGPVETVDALAPDGYRARWEAHHPSGGERRALEAMRAWCALDAAALADLLAPTSFLERERTPVTDLPARPDLAGTTAWPRVTALVADRLAGAGLDVVVVDVTPPQDDAPRVHACKVVVPGLEVENLSYGRLGERGAARLLAMQATGDERVAGLVGLGPPDGPGAPTDAVPVRLHPDAVERLGGPVWFSRARAAALLGPLYALYREPGRHLAAR